MPGSEGGRIREFERIGAVLKGINSVHGVMVLPRAPLLEVWTTPLLHIKIKIVNSMEMGVISVISCY